MTGKDVRIVREKLLLLQSELAEELGVSIATIRLWERGKAQMSIKSKRMLLEYCKKNGVEI